MTIKVIGAGFGRTGTSSLKVALETLLDGRCYHMTELLKSRGHVQYWLDVAAGNPDWSTIFDGFVATVDYPASNYYKELAENYPEAKIILSVRDAERWFQSAQDTIFSQKIIDFQEGTKWGRMVQATINDHLGGDVTDKAAVIGAYNEHVKQVKSTFGPERLLVFDAKDGWPPLCDFFGLPEPDTAYPHVNAKEEFENVFRLLSSPVGVRAMDGDGI